MEMMELARKKILEMHQAETGLTKSDYQLIAQMRNHVVARVSVESQHRYYVAEAISESMATITKIASISKNINMCMLIDPVIDYIKQNDIESETYDPSVWDSIIAKWAASPKGLFGFYETPEPGEGSSRELWVRAFNDWTQESFIKNIRTMDRMDSTSPIMLLISSPGGNPLSMLAMVNWAELVKSPIATMVVDRAASAGGFMLALAGDPGMRYALKDATIMIHGLSAGTMGMVPDMQNDVDFFTRLEKRIFEKLAARTNLTASDWLEKVKGMEDGRREKYMDAEEALSYGIIDKILDRETYSQLF